MRSDKKQSVAYEEQAASSSQAKCLPKMDVTVQPETSTTREDLGEETDFSVTSPEQTPYNEDFDLVTSNINFEAISYFPSEICCTFCPEMKEKLTDPLEKCKKLE